MDPKGLSEFSREQVVTERGHTVSMPSLAHCHFSFKSLPCCVTGKEVLTRFLAPCRLDRPVSWTATQTNLFTYKVSCLSILLLLHKTGGWWSTLNFHLGHLHDIGMSSSSPNDSASDPTSC